MTDCRYCESAKAEPDYPVYFARCVGCGTRALAQSPIYFASAQRGRLDSPYRKELGLLFGDDFEAGHLLVKAEAARIKAARKTRESVTNRTDAD
jgi:hypothetical protein